MSTNQSSPDNIIGDVRQEPEMGLLLVKFLVFLLEVLGGLGLAPHLLLLHPEISIDQSDLRNDWI